MFLLVHSQSLEDTSGNCSLGIAVSKSLVERPALAVRLDLSFRSVYFILFFLSGNIFRTAEPISTKVCTVTASGQE